MPTSHLFNGYKYDCSATKVTSSNSLISSKFSQLQVTEIISKKKKYTWEEANIGYLRIMKLIFLKGRGAVGIWHGWIQAENNTKWS